MKKIFKRIVMAIIILVVGIVIGKHNTHNKKDNFFVVMATDKKLDKYFFEVTDENKIKFKTVE